MTFVGSLIPGVGLIASGRRLLGGFVLLIPLGLLIAAGFVVATMSPTQIAGYAGDRETLLYAGDVLLALAVIWLLVALVSHRSLEPSGLAGGKRFVGALVVIVATSVVVAPMSLAAKNAFIQRDLIGAIAADDDDPPSRTVPHNIDKRDPWADLPRLSLLLLGADIGLGRVEADDGLRADTQIVVSIDTQTGDTTLISLPRNLSRMPFPEDSPLHEIYPQGYIDMETWSPMNANSMLNSVYKNVPSLHPDLHISGSDANKWAVEGALGIEIDYFVMVDLDGFSAIVDALNGITIDVSEPVPIHYGEPDGWCRSRATYIEPGRQRLDGSTALMYARSRCGGDNYQRMRRQQCVMRAIIDEADPARLLTQYQSLAAATKDMVKTDIPADLFPAIIRLTADIKNADVVSMNLDNAFFAEHGGEAASPNYEAVHAAVASELGLAPPATIDVDNPDEQPSDPHDSIDDALDETPPTGTGPDEDAPGAPEIPEDRPDDGSGITPDETPIDEADPDDASC